MAMTFTWARDGSISLVFRFTGMPALSYLQPFNARVSSLSENITNPTDLRGTWSAVAAHELIGLWVLTGVFVAVVVVQAAKTARDAKGGDLSVRQVWERFGNLFIDLAVVGMLLAASATCAWYMVAHAAVFSARQHYQMYDSILTARARWLMPRKNDPWFIPANSTQYFQLQLVELAGVFDATHNMQRSWAIYVTLQAITLVLVIARFLSTLAFQGRVGAIVRTLYHTMPPLAHLVVVFVVLGSMMAIMGHLVLGTYVGPMSTFKGALDCTLSLFFGRGILESFQNILPREMEFTSGERLAATCVMLGQVLLLSFMLINFFFSIINATFNKIKFGWGFRNGTTMWQDLWMVLLPDVAAAAKRWSRKVMCGLLYRSTQPPLTYRQINRLVRRRALAGVDVRPPERKPIQAIILPQHRKWTAALPASPAPVECCYVDSQALRALLLACSIRRPTLQPDQLHMQTSLRVVARRSETTELSSTEPELHLQPSTISVDIIARSAGDADAAGAEDASPRRSIAAACTSPPSRPIRRPLTSTFEKPEGEQHQNSTCLRQHISTNRKHSPAELDALVTLAASRLMARQGHRVYPMPSCHNTDEQSLPPKEQRRRSSILLTLDHGNDTRSKTGLQPKWSQTLNPLTSNLSASEEEDVTDTPLGWASRLSSPGRRDSSKTTRHQTTEGRRSPIISITSILRAAAGSAQDEATRLQALYQALGEAVQAMQKWQMGVQRWQLKALKQQSAMNAQNIAMLSAFIGSIETATLGDSPPPAESLSDTMMSKATTDRAPTAFGSPAAASMAAAAAGGGAAFLEITPPAFRIGSTGSSSSSGGGSFNQNEVGQQRSFSNGPVNANGVSNSLPTCSEGTGRDGSKRGSGSSIGPLSLMFNSALSSAMRMHDSLRSRFSSRIMLPMAPDPSVKPRPCTSSQPEGGTQIPLDTSAHGIGAAITTTSAAIDGSRRVGHRVTLAPDATPASGYDSGNGAVTSRGAGGGGGYSASVPGSPRQSARSSFRRFLSRLNPSRSNPILSGEAPADASRNIALDDVHANRIEALDLAAGSSVRKAVPRSLQKVQQAGRRPANSVANPVSPATAFSRLASVTSADGMGGRGMPHVVKMPIPQWQRQLAKEPNASCIKSQANKSGVQPPLNVVFHAWSGNESDDSGNVHRLSERAGMVQGVQGALSRRGFTPPDDASWNNDSVYDGRLSAPVSSIQGCLARKPSVVRGLEIEEAPPSPNSRESAVLDRSKLRSEVRCSTADTDAGWVPGMSEHSARTLRVKTWDMPVPSVWRRPHGDNVSQNAEGRRTQDEDDPSRSKEGNGD
ncbi:hypothetical protein PLESTB_001414600 [Pleodorina starrii]|uniref:Polycystin cation channel PKD1/PKD2 domain-containing protein n=1 Tax=Pleodorina starrii TaxID=330485 RepID=A0A9W6BUY8_9CHLO|nr:hypothetical protein PLESTB_001414600 [Pleodorina starrii]